MVKMIVYFIQEKSKPFVKHVIYQCARRIYDVMKKTAENSHEVQNSAPPAHEHYNVPNNLPLS